MQKLKFYLRTNLKQLASVLLISMMFSSCTQKEDVLFDEEPSAPLFGKLQLTKDASGAYTMDLETKNDVASDIYVDGNRREINLYASSGAGEKTISQAISFDEEDSFSVKLNNTMSNKTSRLTIFDDDIKFSKESDDSFLSYYSIADNGDSTYTLNFIVADNTEVEFEQNEIGEYEIHLTPGNGNSPQSEYEPTFTKETGQPLVIVFKNYSSSESRNKDSSSNDKPRVIVDTEEDE
ncbi:MAG: Uncharacterised protein [Flavobacterium sp. SCGC AAA160-P02]|nr:MAG: Uncharacterised protein [Flavobacterium sp. SCGC AAA160-P02]